MLLQMTEQVKVLEQSSNENEDTLRLRKATLDLLPDAANNISRLEVSCEPVSCEPQVWRVVEFYFSVHFCFSHALSVFNYCSDKSF